MQLRDLTPEEKSKSYSKYYYLPPAPPDPAVLELLRFGRPIDPAEALAIERINDLLNPGYDEFETGYCVLPNGAGYVAVYTRMPGVTADMVNWWFAWHGLEDLRYKIWWPGGHFAVSLSAADREKVLDPGRSVTQKFQGITHQVVEDVGTGVEQIAISFLTPEEMGFDLDRFGAPAVAALVAANGLSSPADAPGGEPGTPAVMCHLVREIPGGVEFRSRFWLGYRMVDKRPVLFLPADRPVPENVLLGLARHDAHEYANLRAILPRIYGEEGGRGFVRTSD
ncbi:MAG TPA: hydrolase [Spirochaetia bacterium]|nr:hydrolase [Spirochaetia bacterium]